MDFPVDGADEFDAAYTGQPLELPHDDVVDEKGQIFGRHRAVVGRIGDDRLVFGIDPVDDRFIDGRWQSIADLRDRVPDVGDGPVDRHADFKLDRGLRSTFRNCGLDVLDIGKGRDAVLDEPGDLDFDLVGCCSGFFDGHADCRDVDGRKIGDRQRCIALQSEAGEDDEQEDDGHRRADRPCGDVHRMTSVALEDRACIGLLHDRDRLVTGLHEAARLRHHQIAFVDARADLNETGLAETEQNRLPLDAVVPEDLDRWFLTGVGNRRSGQEYAFAAADLDARRGKGTDRGHQSTGEGDPCASEPCPVGERRCDEANGACQTVTTVAEKNMGDGADGHGIELSLRDFCFQFELVVICDDEELLAG